jgi:hypothetical protein
MAKETIKDEQIYDLCSYLIDTFSFKLTKDKVPKPDKQYYIAKNHAYVLTKVSSFRPGSKYYEYEEKSLGLGS